MKNIILTSILLLQITSMVSSFETEPQKMFSGTIEFPLKMDFDLCLFYKGEKLTIEKHHSMPIVEFSFLDSKSTNIVYFIITNGITCNTEIANTLNSLQIIQENSYICYKLQAKRETSEDEHTLLTWEISEHTLDKNNNIPQNSLIFIFDPKLIAGLKIQSWKPENMFRLIPTLLVHPHTSAQDLSRAMTVARLAALDIDALHAKSIPLKPTNAILTALQDPL